MNVSPTQFVRALLVAFVWAVGALGAATAAPPPLELVDVYPGNLDLRRYWVSEKFDGVRGYWDGHELWTRGGQRIWVPAWFTANWPKVPMDGELWGGYGGFARTAATVRAARPDDEAWRAISYRVFDLPAHGGPFAARVEAIRAVVAKIASPWVVAVRQFHVSDDAALHVELRQVLARGGEGLVLHRGDAPYRSGRAVGLFKLKPYLDAEARVVAIRPGRGRLQGLMGSLRVRTAEGREFSIGSGFTDKERAHPPPVGAWVTYRYNGVTATGLPRFARFLRVRSDGRDTR